MSAGVAMIFADWLAGTAIRAGTFPLPYRRNLTTDTAEAGVQPAMGVVEKAHAGLLDRDAITGI